MPFKSKAPVLEEKIVEEPQVEPIKTVEVPIEAFGLCLECKHRGRAEKYRTCAEDAGPGLATLYLPLDTGGNAKYLVKIPKTITVEIECRTP